MDKEQILLTKLQAINWTLSTTLWIFAGVFLTKYVNMELAIQYLGSGGLVSAVIAIIICHYSKKDNVLNYFLNHAYSVLVICNLLQGICIGLVWVSPFVYLISNAICHGSIENILCLTFADITNKIYKNRDKTKLTALNWQCSYGGAILGSILAMIFHNCPFDWAVIVGIISGIIDIPISWWRLKIMIRRLKRENHEITADD